MEAINDNLSRLFRDITREHRFLLQQSLIKYNLYVGQPQVLFCLKRHGKLMQSQLVQETNASKEAMSVSVKRLLKNGMVKKTQDLQDRRVYWITLTDKGNEVIQYCQQVYWETNQRMLQYFSLEERRVLEDFFVKMDKGLKGE